MKPDDKKQVAKLYGVTYNYLESWIENIAFVRNVCAHYGRLYNAKIPKTPMLYKENLNIGVENKYVFATILCLKYLLPNDRHWVEYVDLLELFFEKYTNIDIKLMGFIEGWKNILLK